MGFCYFLYSGGVVLGLWATPAISAPLGWPAVFAIYSAIGFVWTVRIRSSNPCGKMANIFLPFRFASLCLTGCLLMNNSLDIAPSPFSA